MLNRFSSAYKNACAVVFPIFFCLFSISGESINLVSPLTIAGIFAVIFLIDV